MKKMQWQYLHNMTKENNVKIVGIDEKKFNDFLLFDNV
jgi:hypothetical protein